MRKYKIQKKLGQGAFSTVYHAINTDNNQEYALKKVIILFITIGKNCIT